MSTQYSNLCCSRSPPSSSHGPSTRCLAKNFPTAAQTRANPPFRLPTSILTSNEGLLSLKSTMLPSREPAPDPPLHPPPFIPHSTGGSTSGSAWSLVSVSLLMRTSYQPLWVIALPAHRYLITATTSLPSILPPPCWATFTATVSSYRLLSFVTRPLTVCAGGKLSTNQDLGVKVATPVGTLVGQLLFGWLADVVGRKRMCEFSNLAGTLVIAYW
jgi:hypothetical protein